MKSCNYKNFIVYIIYLSTLLTLNSCTTILILNTHQEKLNPSVIDASMISTETLTNLASLILPLESDDKKKLLELNDIQLRLEVLCQFLDSELKVENDLVNFNQIIPTNIKWN